MIRRNSCVLLEHDPFIACICSTCFYIFLWQVATDSECASLLFHRWYIDDGVVAGPISAVLRVLSIIKDVGPPLDRSSYQFVQMRIIQRQ